MDEWRYEPAWDLGLAPGERMRSASRESGLLESAGHLAWWTFIRSYLRLWHRFEVRGAAPVEPPFVMVANHSSHLDVLTLLAPLRWGLRDRVFALAAGDVFFETATSSAFSAFALNALPVWRKRFSPAHFETFRLRLVEEHCAYALFPEGTRSRDGRMGRFKRGIGMLVAGTPVPVLPCRIEGAFEAWPPGARIPRPRKLRLTIGEPLRFESVANDGAGWTAVAESLEKAVGALAPAEGRG